MIVKRLMLNTEMLTRDLGTVLVGQEAVNKGLINEVGGIRQAICKLHSHDGKIVADHRKKNICSGQTACFFSLFFVY